MLVILASMFLLSIHLGGWTWSSWTYAFSLGMVVPLAIVEIKRRAVITGAAIILFSATVLIAAGLPQYFGYSASDLSWYDLTAHFLGAMAITLLLWSTAVWIKSERGHADETASLLVLVISAMLVASIAFELLELFTDAAMGWTNFHPGLDTAGDVIFDVAGIATAALVISRHEFTAMRRPFWHVNA